MKIWWGANIFWIIAYAVITIIIYVRKVDGSGVVQTPGLKIATFIVWTSFIILVFFVQMIIYFVMKRNVKQ
ncbi:DUF3923 family protein [Companilactobacillus metriopterae]|uniref:DUF3923 family protein n=1 Tax=Companilactobacillus metriopterae TaxID=1909267 RepID=UPI00100AACBF|nr:DUF3923 family protein [Companilactobacillus metriopterae]